MKTAVLLSGGVDSATALWSLKQSGHDTLTAFYLKIWLEDETSYLGDCPWEEDLAFAQATCNQAGVPLEVISLQLEYYDRVVQYALDELKQGRTPSPDIFCNQRIKFGAFCEKVGHGFDRIASGHYARQQVVPADLEAGAPWLETDAPGTGTGASSSITRTRARLLRAPDPVKDQSYFLSHLSQEQLQRLVFPIGSLQKREVRALAQTWNLAPKDRPDSQGICFLGKIRYPDFVRHYLGVREGHIVERETGKVLGRHDGFWFHTIGQRTGLGLGNGPWYVVGKDVGENIVWVSHAQHSSDIERTELSITKLTWLGPTPPDTVTLSEWNKKGLAVKLRHGPHITDCTARFSGTDTMQLILEEGDRGIAAGQFAVLYCGEECLGSGTICEDQSLTGEQALARYRERSEQDQRALGAKKQRRRGNLPKSSTVDRTIRVARISGSGDAK